MQSLEVKPVLLNVADLKLRVTPEEFARLCQLNRDLRLELTKDGELIVMPPTSGETGKRNSKLNARSEQSILIPNSTGMPFSEDLNIAALSRLFADKTNSYKFVFFISILDILKRRNFDVSEPISFSELVIEMLANSWYPHTYFKLSFGVQDQIVQKLDSLNLEIGEPILKFTDTDKKLLRETISSQPLDRIVRSLSRYVPFRLIVPFLEGELKTVTDRGKGTNLDVAIPTITARCFNEYKPLYRFNSDRYSECKAIVFHPDWAVYLERHYSIIREWGKTVESYIEDLGIHTQDDLINLEKLSNAYGNLIKPLLSLAINQGFKIWQYGQN
jgi:hypothetical protein